MRCSVLVAVTCYCLVISSATTLRNLVANDRESSAFLRLLQNEVKQEFDKEIQFDTSEDFPVVRSTDALISLNANYSDILFEGDIRLTHGAIVALRGRSRRQAARSPDLLWRDGVPYSLDKRLSVAKRKAIREAIEFWHRETCIDFRPRRKENNYILFVGHDQGCWSSVGKDKKQKAQWISIGEGCQLFGIVAHEIGHSLGVFHQQARPDRDEFVSIIWSRIRRKLEGNFAKAHTTQTYDLPYDYGSVMHYGPTSFTTNPKAVTMSAKDANYFLTMGNREGPSFLDVALVNQLYSCHRHCPPIKCENGGYVDPRNCYQCKCAPVFAGNRCEQRSYGPSSCGRSVKITEEWQSFDAMALKNQHCIFQFEAPEGKVAQFEVIKVEGVCIYGCYEDRIEFRVDRSKLSTGYRFCCPVDPVRRFTAASSNVPVILKATTNAVSATFRYRAV